jgi:hypothetical protein
MKINLSQTDADKILINYTYDPSVETCLRFKEKYNKRVVGSKHHTGYFTFGMRVNGKIKTILNHIAIWILCSNKIPENEIDHKNRIKHDNRIENLRMATHQQNGFNRSINKNNTTGYQRVTYNKKNKCFIAYITKDYKQYYLGSFKTAEEANDAVKKI